MCGGGSKPVMIWRICHICNWVSDLHMQRQCNDYPYPTTYIEQGKIINILHKAVHWVKISLFLVGRQVF